MDHINEELLTSAKTIFNLDYNFYKRQDYFH